jgi:hypothetical protein
VQHILQKPSLLPFRNNSIAEVLLVLKDVGCFHSADFFAPA